MMRSKISLTYYLVLVMCLVLIGVETVVYPGFGLNRYGFSPNYLILVCLGLNLLVRILNKKISGRKILAKFALGSFLLGSAAYWLMYALEHLVYTNFVFSKIHLHPNQFVFLPLFSLGLFLVNLNLKWVKENIKFALLLSPWILLIAGSLIRLSLPNLFDRLLWEDGPVEYLTCLFSLVSGLFSLLFSYHLTDVPNKFEQKWQQRLIQAAYLLLGLGLIFVAGEEISWGQRIFNFETPANINQANLQDEINLHNHPLIFKYVYYAYQVIGLYGAFSRLVVRLIGRVVGKKSKTVLDLLQEFTPPSYLMFWFLLMPFYVKLRYTYGIWSWSEFGESGEMYLMFGFMVWTMSKYIQVKIKTEGKIAEKLCQIVQ